ncbi:MAG: oligosaccharide flippase family protein [Caldilineaceae bacterium]|nr:oligosaccharide flippase family protein [Caldilineaceae bacterium]
MSVMSSPPTGNAQAHDRKVRPLSLRRNFSWTLAGNIIYSGCQWLILILMAKISTPEMVGQYALALAIVTPIVTFSSLQLRTLQSTDAVRAFLFDHYLAVRLAMTMVALLVVALVVGLNGYKLQMILIVLAVTATKSMDFLSDVFYGLLQQRERMDRISISLILHGLPQLMVFGVVLWATQSVVGAVTGMAVVGAMVLLFYDIPQARILLTGRDPAYPTSVRAASSSMRPQWHLPTLRKIVWLGLPLALVTTFNSLSGNVPRYYIAASLGDRELGIFAAMFYLTIAGTTVMGAIAHPASPRLARYFAAGDHAAYGSLLFKLVAVVVATGATGFIIALLAGRPLLTILYRAEYAQHISTFLWLMAAGIPMYISGVLGVGVNATRRFHVQVPLSLMNLLITTGLAAVLIPRFGLDGAGQVIFATAGMSTLATFLVLTWCLRTSPKVTTKTA